MGFFRRNKEAVKRNTDYKPLLKGNSQREPQTKKSLRQQMNETRTELEILNKKYRAMLQMEVNTARSNKSRGRSIKRNCAKIGILYYCINIVQTAQERMYDIESEQYLCDSMNEMGSLLGAVNVLSNKGGTLDMGRLAKELRKSNKSGSGDGDTLETVLQTLKNLSTLKEGSDTIQELVPEGIVARLLNGESIDDCMESPDGVMPDVEDLFEEMDNFAENSKDIDDDGNNRHENNDNENSKNADNKKKTEEEIWDDDTIEKRRRSLKDLVDGLTK